MGVDPFDFKQEKTLLDLLKLHLPPKEASSMIFLSLQEERLKELFEDAFVSKNLDCCEVLFNQEIPFTKEELKKRLKESFSSHEQLDLFFRATAYEKNLYFDCLLDLHLDDEDLVENQGFLDVSFVLQAAKSGAFNNLNLLFDLEFFHESDFVEAFTQVLNDNHTQAARLLIQLANQQKMVVCLKNFYMESVQKGFSKESEVLLEKITPFLHPQEDISLLVSTLQKGSLDLIDRCFKSCFTVDQDMYKGHKPLHYAIHYRNNQILTYLLSSGADPNCTNDDGEPPLYTAVVQGDIKAVEQLLIFGADPFMTSQDAYFEEQNPFDILSVAEEEIKTLFQQGERLIDHYIETDIVPKEIPYPYLVKQLAYAAIEKGDVEYLEKILEKKSGMESISVDVLVQRAIILDRKDCLKCLIDHGVSLSKLYNGKTAKKIAADDHSKSCLRLIVGFETIERSIENIYYTHIGKETREDILLGILKPMIGGGRYISQSKKTELLMMATEYGHKDIIRMFFMSGALLETKKQSALIIALENYTTDLLDLLIDLGADINFVLSSGKTALIHALQSKNLEGVELLIKRGADIHATDKEGRSPLFFAAENGVAVQLLLDHGADPNQLDCFARTPLFFAKEEDAFLLIDRMVDLGGRLDMVDQYGENAFMIHTSLKVKKRLLDEGIFIDAKNIYKETALIKACKRCDKKTFNFLIDHGANPAIYYKNGITSLMSLQLMALVMELISCQRLDISMKKIREEKQRLFMQLYMEGLK